MRIYGSEPGESDIEVPGHRYAALIGGPLDGQLIDVTGWSRQQLVDGTALITELGAFGPGGRTHYEGRPGDLDRLHWIGDTP
ncbi:hypothetical protein ACIRD4_35815 [Streptomyces clavifer]|uniref:hypothetical protein n=1 Tax=Streptomyces clavifer TaxID=68188 RepID=UPI0038306053